MRWNYHGECTSVYDYTLEMTYDKLWHWLLGSHDFTKLLYNMISPPWEDTELLLLYMVALTYGWNPKMVAYYLWIRSLLMVSTFTYQYHININCKPNLQVSFINVTMLRIVSPTKIISSKCVTLADLIKRPLSKIGRASCRERV